MSGQRITPDPIGGNSPSRTSDNEDQPVNNTNSDLVSGQSLAQQRMAAQLIERAVDDMRTDAVIQPRWWRPFWQTGYDRALRDVHEEVQAVLDACDIWYPGGAS